MINWRSIKDDGNPTNSDKKYLVTDGKDMSVSGIYGITHFKGDGNKKFIFKGWNGDDNTWEDNSCCSGTRMFDLVPTHYCPIDELNLPDGMESVCEHDFKKITKYGYKCKKCGKTKFSLIHG